MRQKTGILFRSGTHRGWTEVSKLEAKTINYTRTKQMQAVYSHSYLCFSPVKFYLVQFHGGCFSKSLNDAFVNPLVPY